MNQRTTNLGVEVGRHEPALPGKRLVGGQALHVGILEQAGQVVRQVAQGRVNGHLQQQICY